MVKQESVNQLMKAYGATNPFPNETPEKVLTRVVKIETVTWNSSFTYQTFDLLNTIVQASVQLQHLLGNLNGTFGMFRYLRTGFKVTIKLNSTPYHQGALIASWIPPQYQDTNATIPELAAGNHGVILSASTQDQCEYDIPFISMNPWFDTYKFDTLRDGPKLILTNLNSLVTSSPSVSDSVPITIWIQLMNPEVTGFLPVFYTYATSTTVTSGTMSTQSLEKVVFKSQMHRKHAKEAKEGEKKDAIGQAVNAVADIVEPMVKDIPLLGAAISIGRSIIGSLDKPTSDQAATIITNRVFRGACTLTGSDYPEPLGQHPVESITKDIGLVSSDMQVSQYAQLPNWFQTVTATTAGVVYTTPVHPLKFYNFGSGGRSNPDFLAFSAMPYGFWRGSIKFKVQFVGTAFYSCTFRLSVYYGPFYNSSVQTALADGVATYSKVVVVRGDAWADVEVPYLQKAAWASLGYSTLRANDAPPTFVIEALTPVLGSSLPADAFYYINIYRAGGSDIQFAQLNDVNANATGYEDVVFKSQAALVDVFTKPFEPIVPGAHGALSDSVYMSDMAGSITDSLKRYCQPAGGPVTKNAYPEQAGSSANGSAFFWWANGFAYWRGSRRCRGVITSVETAFLYDRNDNTSQGGGYFYNDGTSRLHFEIPWYCQQAYYPTIACASSTTIAAFNYSPQDCALNNFTPGTGGAELMVAAGDDFAYYHPMAPQPFAVAALLTEVQKRFSTQQPVMTGPNSTVRTGNPNTLSLEDVKRPKTIVGSQFNDRRRL